MLEVVDGGFNDIAREIDAYALSIQGKNIAQISNEEVDSISVEKYINFMRDNFGVKLSTLEVDDGVIREVKDFGLKTIGDLKNITDDVFVSAYKKEQIADTAIGLLRTLLMYNDIDKYFTMKFDWSAIDEPTMRLLVGKYGSSKVHKLLQEHDIEIDSQAG